LQEQVSQSAAKASVEPSVRHAVIVTELEKYWSAVTRQVHSLLGSDGRVEAEVLEQHQTALHAYAWIAAYRSAIVAACRWHGALKDQSMAAPLDDLLFEVGVGRYLSDLLHGIAVSATETVRPSQLGAETAAEAFARNPIVREVMARAEDSEVRGKLVGHLDQNTSASAFGTLAQGEEISLMREQFHGIVEKYIKPNVAAWHAQDTLIPQETVNVLAEAGTFGLSLPEEMGGSGAGLEALCAISEELSRGSLTAGSLMTRSEIAGELIKRHGTPEQQRRYLPRIAAGEILPTATFTEPNAGSDLGSLKTKAVLDGDRYKIFGSKTWITHAARADLMVLLARTDPSSKGARGLSIFLVEKPRGDDDNPFPMSGMQGSEIKVLGYRGMKEYEIGFDGLVTTSDSVLGGIPGRGFQQLMSTFEVARIQTAARAVGVAQDALNLALDYARTRHQFSRPILAFPRIATKIAHIAAELMIVRQQLYEVARLKEQGARCDVEAGMAKLLAARLAWIAADDAVQIHGGNGYALEFPISRVLCDARVLSIFEGAAEIQAQVIARGLVMRGQN
jgi:(2S)-methylsuccinyl-CoA dehydrogenase